MDKPTRHDEHDPDRSRSRDLWTGLGLAAVWPLAMILLLLPWTRIAPEGDSLTQAVFPVLATLVFAVGLSQIPLVAFFAWRAWRMGRPQIVSGLLIGAGVIFLLNGACFAYVWWALRPFG